jgi:hypothetical protein
MANYLVGTRVRAKNAYRDHDHVGDAEGVLTGEYNVDPDYGDIDLDFRGDDGRTFHAPMGDLEVVPVHKGGKTA